MGTTLTITFDGTAPGLTEHRLSVGAYGRALTELLRALRRTTTSVLLDANDPSSGGRGGRYAKPAESVDIQISSVEKGSLVLVLSVVAGVTPLGLPELPTQQVAHAVSRFVDDLEAEARGEVRSVAARRYLKALPQGVASQGYVVKRDGMTVREAKFGEFHVVADASVEGDPFSDLPSFRRESAYIVGVMFDPPQVVLRFEDETVATCAATSDQVDQALVLRDSKVLAAFVRSDSTLRLIWLVAAEHPPRSLTPSERFVRFAADWAKTLEILSR